MLRKTVHCAQNDNAMLFQSVQRKGDKGTQERKVHKEYMKLHNDLESSSESSATFAEYLSPI